jgi:hypothetical protein
MRIFVDTRSRINQTVNILGLTKKAEKLKENTSCRSVNARQVDKSCCEISDFWI